MERLSTVTDRYDYDAWGNEYPIMVSTVDNPYRYVGQLGYYTHWMDPSLSDLLHLGMRFYEPGVGRFSQRDPLGGVVEWYAYGDSTPTLMVDPSGLVACEERARREALAQGASYRAQWNDDPDGGPSNALQHCVWACLTTVYCGPSTCGGIMGHIIDLHEFLNMRNPPGRWIPYLNNSEAARMDLHNNAAGRECAGSAGFHWEERLGGVTRVKVYDDPLGDCIACCERKAYDGQLTWTNGRRITRPKPVPPSIGPRR